MNRDRDEDISFVRPPALAGVEVLRATDCERHWRWYHTTYSICTPLRLTGTGQYLYRGRLHTAGSDHQLVMEPGEFHVTRRIPSRATFRVLFLPQRFVTQVAEELDLGASPPHFPAEPLSGVRLLKSFQRLHACLESEASGALEQQSRLAACVRELLKATRPGQKRGAEPSPAPTRVRRLQDYIAAHFTDSVSLDDLAGVAGLSRFYVAREFAQATGLPPHAYQLNLRVQHARDLLAAGATIGDAAKRCGFVDDSHLGRHFRRVTAVTPGSYVRGLGRASRPTGAVRHLAKTQFRTIQ